MQTNNTALFSSIRVSLLPNTDSVKALATVKVLDSIFLTGLRIIDGKRGLFVSMPSKKEPNGEYKDICFPASKEIRDQMQAAILEVYHDLLAKTEPGQLAHAAA